MGESVLDHIRRRVICQTMSESVYNKAIIPWIVAIALFMETLDITIITTAIPVMALSLKVDPINLKLALTSYLLSIALFIPISGWVADKWGTQRTFILALLIFTVSSMMCGRAGSLSELVIGRIFQGVGGAFMMPVGRLILLRTFTKSELIRALNFVAVPALLGPLLGPFLGGFITTYYSWPWIFYVNVPMGLIGIVTTFCCIKNYKVVPLRRFDMMGFLLFGSSLAAIAFAIEAISVLFHPEIFDCLGHGFCAAGIFAVLPSLQKDTAAGARFKAVFHPHVLGCSNWECMDADRD